MIIQGLAAWLLSFEGVGVPVDGFPNAGERLQLVAINRVRADPNNPAKGTAHECSEPKEVRPPVVWIHDLSQAARFHCTHLSLNGGGLSHQTFCELRDDLESSGCDGSSACSCVEGTECWNCDTLGGCGSGPDARAGIFGFDGGVAEVGAAGYGTGWDAVGGWVTENPCESATLAHRDTVTGDYDVVGVGEGMGGSCWGTYFFADFGRVDGLAIPAIPSGAFRGGFGSGELLANWFHPGGDPTMIAAVVDGACTPMDVDLGMPGNATFIAPITAMDTACHEYWFIATDIDGNRVTYPEVGALTFGTGCASEYVAERTAADCDASGGDEGTDGGSADEASGGGSAGDESADDGTGEGGTTPGGDEAGSAGSDGTDDGALDEDDAAGCGCRSDSRAPSMLLLALFLVRRRRDC